MGGDVMCLNKMYENYYYETVRTFFPHLMSMYDLDPFSPTTGLGDRYYWGWKLKDFPNGLLQGGVYSIALYWKLGFFKSEKVALDIIKIIFLGVKAIQHKNGSVDEAFPYEYAFSVSSTLAFDLVQTYRLICDQISEYERQEYRDIISKLISFISKHQETHGFISNHLAAAAAAIEIYNVTFSDSNPNGQLILSKIIEHQYEDGFYLEYEGADPGYQTLCTYYLAELFRLNQDQKLLNSLKRSITFLAYFFHPDGSMGGEYGSRNTELYYPGGFEILRNNIPCAGVIADWMYASLSEDRSVTLFAIDTGNCIPLLENYLVAYQESLIQKNTPAQGKLPWQNERVSILFKDSGIIVKGNERYYAILNIFKGGVLKIFDKRNKKMIWDDCGYVAMTLGGSYITTQCYMKKIFSREEDSVVFETYFYGTLREITNPLKFFGLRFCNLTIMRNLTIGNFVKNLIIRLLITNKKKYPLKVKRTIHFEHDEVYVNDILVKNSPHDCVWLCSGGKFCSIHMASSKYYQLQVLSKQIPSKIDISELNRCGEQNISYHIKFEGESN